MTGVQVSGELEGLDELMRRFRRAPERFEGYMRRFFGKALPVVEREVKVRTPVNTGALRSSVGFEIEGAGARMQGIVGTPKDYAPFVELDTRPHWPPFIPIAYWVHRKLRVAGELHYAVTRAIQRKIARFGTKGKHMFETAFEETRERVGDLWSDVWGEAVVKEL